MDVWTETALCLKGLLFLLGCTRHPPRLSKERVLETLHLQLSAPQIYRDLPVHIMEALKKVFVISLPPR